MDKIYEDTMRIPVQWIKELVRYLDNRDVDTKQWDFYSSGGNHLHVRLLVIPIQEKCGKTVPTEVLDFTYNPGD